MKLAHCDACGQSMIEMTLIIGMVVLVGWGSLQLISNNIKQEVTSYSAQYSGSGAAASNSNSAPYSTGTYSTTPRSGTTYVQTLPDIPKVVALSNPTPNTTASKATGISPTASVNITQSAAAASGDGCMGCAASMTTDLGW